MTGGKRGTLEQSTEYLIPWLRCPQSEHVNEDSGHSLFFRRLFIATDIAASVKVVKVDLIALVAGSLVQQVLGGDLIAGSLRLQTPAASLRCRLYNFLITTSLTKGR